MKALKHLRQHKEIKTQSLTLSFVKWAEEDDRRIAWARARLEGTREAVDMWRWLEAIGASQEALRLSEAYIQACLDVDWGDGAIAEINRNNKTVQCIKADGTKAEL